MKISKNDIIAFVTILDQARDNKVFKSDKAFDKFAEEIADQLDCVFDNFNKDDFEWKLYGL